MLFFNRASPMGLFSLDSISPHVSDIFPFSTYRVFSEFFALVENVSIKNLSNILGLSWLFLNLLHSTKKFEFLLLISDFLIYSIQLENYARVIALFSLTSIIFCFMRHPHQEIFLKKLIDVKNRICTDGPRISQYQETVGLIQAPSQTGLKTLGP